MVDSRYVAVELKLKGQNHGLDEVMKYYEVPARTEPYVEAVTGQVSVCVHVMWLSSYYQGPPPSLEGVLCG